MTKWSISAKWTGQHQLDCTLAGITKRCHGKCCHGPTYWPGKSGPDGMRCVHLGEQGCTLTPQQRPVTCLLYPLRLNDKNKLVVHQRAILPHGCCAPNWEKGPLVVEVLQPQLAELFGQHTAARIVAGVKAGENVEFAVPQPVLEALQREARWETDNTPPVPRGR